MTASCWASRGTSAESECRVKRRLLFGTAHNSGGRQLDSCTFTNTVFFEGIPTLSQYGLALMALLMLGVGMVGFRRFA